MPGQALLQFLKLEAAGGILLVVASAVAMIWANTPGGDLYFGLLGTKVSVLFGDTGLSKTLLHWINDGLMAIFFLLVGLEIKREVMEGNLSSLSQAALPSIAAVGGMVVPAAIYLALNWGNPFTTNGWAIPAATDIAFALGILALLGRRAPASLKIFLLAVAIIDDLGAIVIIALFYTADLSQEALGLAGLGVIVLVVLNRAGVTRIAPYVLVGVFLWTCVLKSGVHATLAGVALAFAIPLRGREPGDGPLVRLEHMLHPWVAFGILPVFAFANAGVPLAGLSFSALLDPVTLGIILGLFVGKQVGVLATTWMAIRLGLGVLPDGSRWIQVYGVAVLTGIGFTMSLFIGELAFEGGDQSAAVRVGVLSGSLLSAVVGYAVLFLASRREFHTVPAGRP
ncbi:MAG: Na+/H+ antiporter NhaA [Rhodospirillales bacterium]|nr:Na+/H+ antiporter NhaA [Rhodospirillales bacterium]